MGVELRADRIKKTKARHFSKALVQAAAFWILEALDPPCAR